MRKLITILMAMTLLLAMAGLASAAGDGINFISSKPLDQPPPGFWTNDKVQAAMSNPKDALRPGSTPNYASQAEPTEDPQRSAPGYNPDGETSPAPGVTADYTAAASCPASSYDWNYDTAQQDYPQRVVGKLLFVDPFGQLSSCSASLIGADLVLTAGHCLVTLGMWHTNVTFIPGYLGGSEPYGSAGAIWGIVNTNYLLYENLAYDVAMAKLETPLGDTVGWLGLTTGGDRNQTHWIQYGYPANDPYDGSTLVVNNSGWGTDDCSNGPPCNVGVGSAHTNGSSGGPWLLYREDGPYANGVNSYYYLDCLTTMYSPYFGDAVWNLYQEAIAN